MDSWRFVFGTSIEIEVEAADRQQAGEAASEQLWKQIRDLLPEDFEITHAENLSEGD